MEILYNIIKKMDVVNVADGKHLGKIYDILFDFPENRIQGFYVTGGKGFRFTRQDVFVPVSSIIRIGEDVILTDLQHCIPQKGKKSGSPARQNAPAGAPPQQYPQRRSYDEYE